MNIPSELSFSQMSRPLWIAYTWIDITEPGDKERRYLRRLERPISESVSAAEQFDTMWSAWQAVSEIEKQ